MDAILFLVALFSACVAVCSACSCFPYSGPDSFCSFDLIFRGMALAEYEEREEPLDHSDPFSKYSPFKDWVYTVRVDKPIVMPSNMTGVKTVQLRTPTQGSMCGTRFPLDVDAVFFARVNYEGEVVTGLCEPNAPWESMNEWDQELITEHIPDYCANKKTAVTPPEP